jgi:hypothetical protein
MASKKRNDNLREAGKEMWKGFWRSFLVFSPAFVGLVIIFMAKGDPLIFSLGSFFAGFTGIIIMTRKEIPTVVTSIRGTRAIIEGALITIILWGVSIFVLIESFKIHR